MKRPDFFIVGAPRCGTTAMFAYLRAHPQIFMPNYKEPHFFGSDVSHPRRFSMEEYLALFAGAEETRRAGEASVSYLFSQKAAREIKEFNPDSSIIIMLRNPVDMIYSWHSQLLYLGIETVQDFETALSLEEKRRRGDCLPDAEAAPQAYFYREVARFTPQVRRYLDVFCRERVHIIIFDDLRIDRVRIFRETLRFLAVTDDFQSELNVVNPNKQFRIGRLQTFMRQPPSALRTLSHALMPRRLRNALYDRLSHLNTSYKPRPPMDPELKKRLQAEFAPDVEELGALLGRDLSRWSKQ